MAIFIDGQTIAKKINAATKQKVAILRRRGCVPKLAVVLVGDDKPSVVYVRQKQKMAEALGINFVLHKIADSVTLAQFKKRLEQVQTDPNLSGLIVQLPLPESLYQRAALNSIKPELDIDFLTDVNLGSVVSKSNYLEPPTAGAMLEVVRSLKIKIKGKHVIVIGAGVLVGRPLALMLLKERATVTVCNSATQNLSTVCRQADIIMSCVGKRNLIQGSMIKPGAVVIDAGFIFENAKISGDVNVEEVVKVAKYVTPTPGGVGPVTVALLLHNVVANAAYHLNKNR